MFCPCPCPEQVKSQEFRLSPGGTRTVLAMLAASVPSSRLNPVRRVLRSHELMFVQTLLTQPSVKAFNHRGFGRLAGVTEVDLDLEFICTAIHRLADQLTAVVGLDRLRRTAFARSNPRRLQHIPPTGFARHEWLDSPA